MPDNRYRVLERVAAGGMAEVFKGVAESIQGFRKTVAIKRVLPALTKNKKFVAMFLDEARLSLGLQHANVVQVFDIGHADETYFIVMEFVDGVDMKALIEWRRRLGRPLTIGQTVYIILEVCKGLAYAHEATHPETGKALGLVHRDVSPPNVLFSRNGEVKVTDFGLAKAAVQVEHTDPGVVKGKMSYLSPEAARGEDVDARADIFAVGILLYEMLTGKRLFYGESDYQTVELVRSAKIPPIAPQNPEVEGELEEIVRKSLARRADDRFQSATDLQDALAHYLFSRGLKMIQRDIAELVRACVDDMNTLSGAARKAQKANSIDTLLQDELKGFTSLDFEEPGAEPLVPTGMDMGHGAPGGGDFVDPRSWSTEADWPSRKTTGQRNITPAGLTRVAGQPLPGHAPVPAPSPSSGSRSGPVARPLTAAEAAAARGNRAPGFANAGQPTPGPEALADALEPQSRAAGGQDLRDASAGPQGRAGKGLVVGIILGAVAVGLAFATFVLK